MKAFAQAASELRIHGTQNLLLTVEPGGPGLLWRLRFRGRVSEWPHAELAGRVAQLLPEQVLLDDAISLEFWGMTFRVRSETFVQTNYRQMLVLYETALDMLAIAKSDRVLDLYAGIGTISAAIARAAESVTAVEENPHAIQLGRLNARINSAKVEYLPGKVVTALRQVRIGRHGAAVLDPPRAGVGMPTLKLLAALRPKRIHYASCQPRFSAARF